MLYLPPYYGIYAIYIGPHNRGHISTMSTFGLRMCQIRTLPPRPLDGTCRSGLQEYSRRSSGWLGLGCSSFFYIPLSLSCSKGLLGPQLGLVDNPPAQPSDYPLHDMCGLMYRGSQSYSLVAKKLIPHQAKTHTKTHTRV